MIIHVSVLFSRRNHNVYILKSKYLIGFRKSRHLLEQSHEVHEYVKPTVHLTLQTRDQAT
jgi:hypothetical protein